VYLRVAVSDTVRKGGAKIPNRPFSVLELLKFAYSNTLNVTNINDKIVYYYYYYYLILCVFNILS